MRMGSGVAVQYRANRVVPIELVSCLLSVFSKVFSSHRHPVPGTVLQYHHFRYSTFIRVLRDYCIIGQVRFQSMTSTPS